MHRMPLNISMTSIGFASPRDTMMTIKKNSIEIQNMRDQLLESKPIGTKIKVKRKINPKVTGKQKTCVTSVDYRYLCSPEIEKD